MKYIKYGNIIIIKFAAYLI